MLFASELEKSMQLLGLLMQLHFLVLYVHSCFSENRAFSLLSEFLGILDYEIRIFKTSIHDLFAFSNCLPLVFVLS